MKGSFEIERSRNGKVWEPISSLGVVGETTMRECRLAALSCLQAEGVRASRIVATVGGRKVLKTFTRTNLADLPKAGAAVSALCDERIKAAQEARRAREP